MIPISNDERKAIEKRFPEAEIVSTRHHSFLIDREQVETLQFLHSLRGAKSPTPRKEKERSKNLFQHIFSKRSSNSQDKK